ncbi:MAG: transglutaminase domain-containing protein [Treponemataceae bacterium]
MKQSFFIFAVFLSLSFFSCTQSLENTNKANAHVDTAFLYNSNLYLGREENKNAPLLKNLDKSFKLTKPNVANFNADAFFYFSGTVNNNPVRNYAIVTVTKDGTDLTAKYYPRNDFSFRIWLPFGKGNYTVKIYKLLDIEVHRVGEGNISSVSYNKDEPLYVLKIFNTRDEDGRFLYPSYFIQSDNDEIQELAKNLQEGKKTDMEIIKAIHDYVCYNVRYDYESILSNDPENKLYRKQDAKSVLDSGLAVCEGYTSLTAALLRSLGIKAKAVIGTLKLKPSDKAVIHAWLHVMSTKNNITKYRLLDTTNNDNEEVDKNNNYEFIDEREPLDTYFLRDIENHKSTHFQGTDDKNAAFENDDGLYKGTRPWR